MTEKEVNVAIQETLSGVAIPGGVWKESAPSGLEEGDQYAVWSLLNPDALKDADGEVWRIDIELNVWGAAEDEGELADYSNTFVSALENSLGGNLPDGATLISVDYEPVKTGSVAGHFGQANRDVRMMIEG